MKRSRIFLFLTTMCLGIAGVVAAKVTRFGAAHAVFLQFNGQCVQTFATCLYDSHAMIICTILAKPAYTTKILGECHTVLTYSQF